METYESRPALVDQHGRHSYSDLLQLSHALTDRFLLSADFTIKGKTGVHSADRTWLQKPISWTRLLQYFSKNSSWIRNFDKRLLNPFSDTSCLACNFKKKYLPVIFRHARWAPNFAECRLMPFLGKFINLIFYIRGHLLCTLLIYSTGDPFLFENYGVYVGKRVYFMNLDKERERES